MCLRSIPGRKDASLMSAAVGLPCLVALANTRRTSALLNSLSWQFLHSRAYTILR
jgi:hypothetical protein